jgi:hypothetical protein
VLCESAPGPVAVMASGGVSERPPIKGCSDVARWVGSVNKLVVSLLRSAFRLLSMGMRTKKQPMRHHALLPQKFRWHKYGNSKVRVDSRKVGAKVGPFIQAVVSSCPSHECALSLRYFDFYAIDSGGKHT